MNNLTDLFTVVRLDTLDVPIWEILAILSVTTVCLLLRGSKTGLLITYAFTLHIAFNFFKKHFSLPALLIFGLFGAVVLLIGLYEALTER